MREFNKNFGGRQNFGKRPENFKMFTTTCAECGKSCEVPFKPNGSRPVYCKECFGKQGGSHNVSHSRNSFRDASTRDPQGGNGPLNDIKTALSMINIKLDKVLSAIESATDEIEEADSGEFHAVPEEVVKEVVTEKPLKPTKKKSSKKRD
ncbi:MAG: CxxC-x17-CxxC domain-containing protein [Candidatus Paceibacterota bacterium]|jgi:CxxC-x17-CxxC domain-containing protein